MYDDNKKVLILRNKKLYSELLEKLLVATDENAVYASSLEQAREVLSEFSPDVIIADIDMLPERGRSFFKTDDKSKPSDDLHSTVIMVSSDKDVQKAISAVRAGTVDFIVVNDKSKYNGLSGIGFTYTDEQEKSRKDEFRKLHVNRLQVYAKRAPGVLYCLDVVNNRYTFLLPNIEELTGYTVEEISVDPYGFLITIISPDDIPRREQLINKYKGKFGKNSDSIDFKIARADGETIWIREILNIESDGHSIVMIDGILLELHETAVSVDEVELEPDSSDFYRELLEGSPDGICVLLGKRIVFANHKMFDMFDESENTLLGSDLFSYVHDDKLEETQTNFDQKKTTSDRICIFETEFVRKDKKRIYAEVNVSAIGFEGGPADLVTLRDISDRKWEEEELRGNSKRLGVRAEEADNELRRINEQLQLEIERHKDTAVKLTKSEKNLRAFAKAIPDVIYKFDILTGEYVFLSPAIEQLLGYSIDEIQFNPKEFLHDKTHPDDLKRILKLGADFRAAGQSNEILIAESRVENADGKYIWIRNSLRYIWENDRPIAFTGIMSDITDIKQADEVKTALLNISQAVSFGGNFEDLLDTIYIQLDRLIDASNFYIAIYNPVSETYSFPFNKDEHDPDDGYTNMELKQSLTEIVRKTGKPLLVDEKTHKDLIAAGEVGLVGKPAKYWMGVPLKDEGVCFGVAAVQIYEGNTLYDGNDVNLLDSISGSISLAIARKQAYDELRAHKDHLENLVGERTAELQQINQLLITEAEDREKAEEARRASDQRFRAITESAFAGIGIVDLNENIIYVNPAFSRMLGYSPNELQQMNLLMLVGSDDQDTILLETETRKEGKSGHYEAVLVHKNGKSINVFISASPLTDSDGEVYAMLAVIAEFTERKRVESELRRKNLMLKLSNARADEILRNILPDDVVDAMDKSSITTPRLIKSATVISINVVGFSQRIKHKNYTVLFSVLEQYFKLCDDIVRHHGLEKLRTSGDAYMFAGGLFVDEDQLENAINASLEILDMVKTLDWDIRIGIHNGPCIAGLIHGWRMTYDVWGEAASLAFRLQVTGETNFVSVSEAVYNKTIDLYKYGYRGEIEIPGAGLTKVYTLTNENKAE